MSKRALFIYPWALHEAIGARVALLSYGRALVRHGLTVDCFAPCPVPVDADQDGLVLGVFDRVFTPPQTSPTLRVLVDAAGAGCMDPALPSQHGCDGAAMFAAATVAATGQYDLIGVHYARLHAIQPLLPPDVPAIMFTYELDAVVAAQEALIFGTTDGDYTLEMEAERVAAFDAVTTVGPDDCARLLEVLPSLPVTSAPMTVAVAPQVPARPDARVLLLLSSSAIFHELSLAWFLSHAWPAIKAGSPGVRLLLAGHICQTARRFGADADPQIELLGLVDDPAGAYERADVFIAPYYFGDGIKLKVLEALARGLPVVTTTPGLSNTALVPNRDLLVADDGPGFADAVLRVLQRPELRTSLQRRALDFISQHHHPRIADRALQHVVDSVLTAGSRRSGDATKTELTRQRFVAHLQMVLARTLSKWSSPAIAAASPSVTHLTPQLRALLPWTIHRARATDVRTVAFYGAGSHTRLMLPIWRALGGPVVRSIVVSGVPTESTCCDVPVVSADDFDPSSVDAVVLSSQGYERVMAATCAARWPSLPVFPVWSPPITDGESAALPSTHVLIPVVESHAQTVHR
jgi:hypothetical protein